MASCLNCCSRCFDSDSGSNFIGLCTCCRYNVAHCRDHHDLICRRNYTILGKICNKIFRDFIREKCRKKYKYINARTHRSGSGDADNSDQNNNTFQNFHRGKEGEIDPSLKTGQRIYGQSANKHVINKLHEYRDDNNTAITKKTKGRRRRRVGSKDDSKHEIETLVDKKRRRKSDIKEKKDDNGSETGRRTKKSHRKHKSDSVKSYTNAAIIENPHSKKAENETNEQSKIIELKNRDTPGKKMKGRKSNRDIGLHTKASKLKPKESSGKDTGSGDAREDKANNGYRQECHKSNGNRNIPRDLRIKNRSRENHTFDVEPQKSKKSVSHPRKITHSRADDTKYCDFLRARMEQRDICKLYCQLKLLPCITYAVSYKTCTPNFRPNNLISHHSGSCGC